MNVNELSKGVSMIKMGKTRIFPGINAEIIVNVYGGIAYSIMNIFEE